jgi:triacylglycerol lipase
VYLVAPPYVNRRQPKERMPMMSRALRGALAVEAVSLLLILFLRGGTAAATVAAALVLNVGVVVAIYATFRASAARYADAGHARGLRAWRCALGELLATFAAFAVLQPFERWWMGKEPARAADAERPPVLLVHGYLCNRGVWWWLRRRLRDRRFAVATINLEPPLASLDTLARQLAARIDALAAGTGTGKVMLVTHSMGGLVARAYLQQHGAVRVAALVTLAAPHHGTVLARLAFGRNARQMRPDSEWLRHLDAQPLPPVPIASLWTRDDEIVAPPDSGRLAGARETVLDGIGHLAMLFSPRVLACVTDELSRA